MELRIVNAKPRYRPVPLVEPPGYGYIHIAAAVDPPSGPPFVRASDRRNQLLANVTASAKRLADDPNVIRATVYRALIVPPTTGYAKGAGAHEARYDVALLIEATSPGALDDLRAVESYREVVDTVRAGARDVHILHATCVKSAGNVDKTRQGLMLFNYFVAEDAEVALQLWDYLADWYRIETGLDNSTLLAPIGPSDYVFVNHARWDYSLPRFMLHQVTKPAFFPYVQANLKANRVGAMPILYRIVGSHASPS